MWMFGWRSLPNYAQRNPVCVIGHVRHWANWPFSRNYAQRNPVCVVSRWPQQSWCIA